MFKILAIFALAAVASAAPGFIATPVVKTIDTPVLHTYAAAPVVKSVSFTAPVLKTVSAPVVHTYAAAPVVKTIATPVVHTYAAAPVVKTIATAPVVHSVPVVHSAPLVKSVCYKLVTDEYINLCVTPEISSVSLQTFRDQQTKKMFKFVSFFALLAVASAAPGFLGETHHTLVQPAVLTKTAVVDTSASSAVTHQSFTNLEKKVPVVATYAAAPTVVKTVAAAPVVHTYESAPVVKSVSYAAAPVVKSVSYSAPVIKTVAAAPVVKSVSYSAPVVKTIAAAPVVHTYQAAPVVKSVSYSAPVIKTVSSPVVYETAPVVKTIVSSPVTYDKYH
ncbi:uncharacterized protein ACRADG_003254 [Cochliomyia hominivorax]